jgi:serine/threonine protein phosphatase PrpC
MAVADGHGDLRHDRSATGAAFAVHAALDAMFSIVRNATDPGSLAQARRMFRGHFPTVVRRHWQDMVRTDAGQTDASGDDKKLFSRYGTTLITALTVRNTLLISKLGDGTAVVVWPDGTVESPFPEEKGVGDDVWSMSSQEALLVWQTVVLDVSKGALVLLATDGLVKSFDDMNQFHIFVKSLADRIRDYDMGKIASVLPSWLDGYSARASGDDITLALAHIGASLPPAGESSTSGQGEPPVSTEFGDDDPDR